LWFARLFVLVSNHAGFPFMKSAFGGKKVTDLGGKVVAFRRQNRVCQLKDTWPIGFLCLYVSSLHR
jgi:hypothetical protein